MFSRNRASHLPGLLSRGYIKKLTSIVLAGILIACMSSIILTPLAWADDFFKCFDATKCTQALSSSQTCQEPDDYEITLSKRGSDVTILSFHGGEIEPKTSEISYRLAEKYKWNRYDLNAHGTDTCLDGKDNFQRLHITSTNFDDPDALNLVKSYHNSVSIHGYNPSRNKSRNQFKGYPIGTICVGGKNRTQIDAFINYVNEQKSIFESQPESYRLIPVNANPVESVSSNTSINDKPTCAGLKGDSRRNIVNKNKSNEGGLQVELSLRMRHDLANLDEIKFNSLRDVIYGAIAQAMAN
jgi:phage replication-related protein YjqB (UPF0714/DUF867 family)